MEAAAGIPGRDLELEEKDGYVKLKKWPSNWPYHSMGTYNILNCATPSSNLRSYSVSVSLDGCKCSRYL